MNKFINKYVFPWVELLGEATLTMTQWMNSRWEWYFVLIALVCIKTMVSEVSTAIFFCLVGVAFLIPPFCALPFAIIYMSYGMATMGRPFRFNVYKRCVGWALYIAIFGFFIGSVEGSVESFEEVLSHRLAEIQQDFWLGLGVYGAMMFVSPFFLFFWTRKERLKPTEHKWDQDLSLKETKSE
jgi:hypothetical protein